MGNLLWGHYKGKIPLSLLSVQCIFTNAAICTWRQGSHTGWPELFKKDTEVQSAGNQSTEPFSFKFCAENIWPVNQYGRLLTWLQNWITKPTLEHLAPLTTWTAAQSKYSSLFERHSKCFLQLGHFFCLIDSYFAGPTFWNTVGRALPYPTWQKTFSKLTRTYLPCCMISTQIKKHSAEAYIFRSLKTFKMQLKWQKSSIFKCNLLPAFIVFNESTNGTMNSNIHATWLSLEQTVE